MSDLAEFLLARIAEDEAWVRGDGGMYLDDCQECAFGQQPDSPYSRARVLAECDAKRRIVEEHRPILPPDSSHSGWCRMCLSEDGVDSQDYGGYLWPCRTMLLLALPYADHPDYREEWRR